MIRSRTDLLKQDPTLLATLSYFPFYGHRANSPSRQGPWCLSQWWQGHPFVIEGITFPTAEHWMMYQKAILFDDAESAIQILTAPNPGAAKAIGRRVSGYDDALWSTQRFAVALAGNQAKFTQHPQLAAWILTTRPSVLVEASPTDRIWGVGLPITSPAIQDPRTWRGENLLGFVLMAVRAQLTR